MARILALLPQAVLLALVGYTLLTSVAGWRTPAPAPRGERRRRLVVVIPAHDEEAVVASLVGDLRSGETAPDGIWVVADRCTDATAAAASAAGASVLERRTGGGGKGAALAWFLEQRPLPPDSILVVLDADNRVPPDLLGRISDEVDRGAAAVQAYLDVTRPDGSWVALASALSYWASNRMVQLSRHNLGWTVDLGGTGMAFITEALGAAGGFADSLVEDQDLGVRLALAGVDVAWMHDVRVRDEKPTTATVAVRQRARWAAGRRQVARRHFFPLLRAGLARRRWAHIDHAVRLIQPGRAFTALLTASLAIVSAVVGGDALLGWPVWAVAAAAQFLFPIPFLLRERVPWRWVIRYPLLAGLAILWVPVQVASRRVTGWRRTPHRGDA